MDEDLGLVAVSSSTVWLCHVVFIHATDLSNFANVCHLYHTMVLHYFILALYSSDVIQSEECSVLLTVTVAEMS